MTSSKSLTTPALYEEAIRRGEGKIAADGPLVCATGRHTGRSPNDKFFVREPSSADAIAWGRVNHPMDEERFATLERDLVDSLHDEDLFVLDCHACAAPEYRLPIRVVTELAWHCLFARNLFMTGSHAEADMAGRFTIVCAPAFKADPSRHGTHSDVVIAINLARRLVLIGGTSYAGEIKKSVFTILNYLLPARNVLPMHCSANVGSSGDVALFFGLSGTGKTTLSSDPARCLIGDDEHGWSEDGVFNFEGGCYAKTIHLSAEAEPEIFAAARRFGTVLENVAVDEATRSLDFDDGRVTENTRAAYPISFIANAVPSGVGRHPSNVIMLAADAFGVLPPIARLTPEGASYHFLSGYTAKVAGTERGVTEPTATFSTCFGAPFLPLPAARYSRMLGERIARHDARVWLVNTGWSGGSFGTGSRMSISLTRAIVAAALAGALDDVPYDRDPRFNVDVPTACPGVPADVLQPRRAWVDRAAYDRQAAAVASRFVDNFRVFERDVTPAVLAAGPRA